MRSGAPYRSAMRVILAASVAVFLLTSCTSKPNETATATAKPDPVASAKAAFDAMPKCSEIWIDGRKLPADYEGCKEADGVIYADVSTCDGTVHTYEPDGGGFFTTKDRVIHDGGADYADDPRYATDC